MWELDHKEGWMPKNWCFLILALKKALESALVSKEFKPISFPGGSDSKESACNVEDRGLIPGLGRSPGQGDGNPLLTGESPCTEEPGALQSMGLQRVRHNWATNAFTEVLKEINLKYSLEGLMLKLTLLYFGHLIKRVSSLERTLMVGKIGNKRKKRWQRMRWLGSISHSMDMNLSNSQK